MKSLQEFISESLNEDKNKIIHINKGDRGIFKDPNGYLEYFEICQTYPIKTHNCIELSIINTYDKKKGTGSSLIAELIKYANMLNKSSIVAYASPLDENMAEDDLIKFYEKCGFEHDSRSKDKHCMIYKIK